MRLIAFSDSHGNPQALERVARVQAGAECYIFLGDGLADAEHLRGAIPGIPLIALRGNCDALPAPGLRYLHFGHIKIMCTHGHLFSVKRGLDTLWETAKKNSAAVALFGHTHIPHCECRDGVWLVNPGNLAGQRELRFSVVDIDGAAVFCHTAVIAR